MKWLTDIGDYGIVAKRGKMRRSSLLDVIIRAIIKETGRQAKKVIKKSSKPKNARVVNKTRKYSSENISIKNKVGKNATGEIKTVHLESIDGQEFEKLCEKIFSNLNYGKVERTVFVGDKGKDLIINKENEKIFVECKHHLNGTIGRPVIQKLHSAIIMEDADKGLVVTTGSFSEGAIIYAKKVTPPIELIDMGILFDYAMRAGFKLISSYEEGNIYSYPLLTDKTLIKNISTELDKKLISKPIKIEKNIRIFKRNITMKPVFAFTYEINAVFSTSVGVIHEEIDKQRMLIDGTNGNIIESSISSYLIGGNKEKYQQPKEEDVEIRPFKILTNQMNDTAFKRIINKHTSTISYIASNNRQYTKECEPKKKDISMYNVEQIYYPDSEIRFDLIGKKRYFRIISNGTKDFLVRSENTSTCEICKSRLNNLGILCNDCGNISHNKKFFKFFSHGFYCRQCGKSICRICTSYYSRCLVLKVVLCKDCAKQEKERVIKKFKSISKTKR